MPMTTIRLNLLCIRQGTPGTFLCPNLGLGMNSNVGRIATAGLLGGYKKLASRGPSLPSGQGCSATRTLLRPEECAAALPLATDLLSPVGVALAAASRIEQVPLPFPRTFPWLTFGSCLAPPIRSRSVLHFPHFLPVIPIRTSLRGQTLVSPEVLAPRSQMSIQTYNVGVRALVAACCTVPR